jgi:5'-3' exonuclease
MKYLLIDGNNLAIRCAFSNAELKSKDGIPTGIHYGTMQSLMSIKPKFKDYQMLIVWDGKSKRRMEESAIGVQNGIIPELYKGNRKKGEEMQQPLIDFYAQAPYLQRAIGQTGIPQIRLSDYEADDVVASYCSLLKDENEVVCLTSDGDYFQLLDSNVTLFDGMKNRKTTKESYWAEYEITPKQHIDVGAFMGDDGDNIFGVDGWGIKTAVKEIKKYGSWQNVIKAYETEYGELRKKYIDLHESLLPNAREQFKKLSEQKSNPDKENSRLKYPGIYWGIPYSGVAWAFENGDIKMPKTTLMALMFQNRVELAYSLKKMDCNIPNLPEIKNGDMNREKLLEYFDYYDIETLKDGLDVLEGKITINVADDIETIETDMSSLAEELNA